MSRSKTPRRKAETKVDEHPKAQPSKKRIKKLKSSKRKQILWNKLERVHLHVAGIDVGAYSHWAAVPPELVGEGESSFKEFNSFTTDLEEMAIWFKELKIESVAMEATGVYWIPLAQVLESHNIRVLLVHPAEVKQVAGRKSDIKDCQWIMTLHMYGLLSPCFRPDDSVCKLRSLTRYRLTITENRSDCLRRMQKSLDQMNVQLHHVVSMIHGVTGLKIIEAILSGERDPQVLVKLRDPAIRKSTVEEMKLALQGDWREEHLATLKLSYEHYQFLGSQLKELDMHINEQLKNLANHAQSRRKENISEAHKHMGKTKKRQRATRGPNAPHINMMPLITQWSGTNLGDVLGLNLLSIIYVLAETGVDMNRWRNAKAFTNWLGLAPRLFPR